MNQSLTVDHPKPVTGGIQSLSDEAIVQRVLDGERFLFSILVRRYNRRLFRAARSIVSTNDEAEAVVQEAFVRAHQHLEQSQGQASWVTGLTRIAVHDALARKCGKHLLSPLEELLTPECSSSSGRTATRPGGEELDAGIINRQMARLIERAVDGMPAELRNIFVFRQLEGLSAEETSEALGVPLETVKTRLHFARLHLREAVSAHAEAAMSGAFNPSGPLCDRVVRRVMRRIG